MPCTRNLALRVAADPSLVRSAVERIATWGARGGSPRSGRALAGRRDRKLTDAVRTLTSVRRLERALDAART